MNKAIYWFNEYVFAKELFDKIIDIDEGNQNEQTTM